MDCLGSEYSANMKGKTAFSRLKDLSAGQWKFLFFLTGFLIPVIVFSQEIRFDHLSVKQGLSQGNVWNVHQDKLGFIWIATEDGVNVYDGYNFTVYRNNPADSFSISNNNIDLIKEDKDGNLWIATQHGLNFYNRKLNRFERHMHDPKNPGSLSNDDIGEIFIDKKNRLWVGTNNGLNLYNSKTNSWKHYLNDPANPNFIIGQRSRRYLPG